MSTHEHDSDHDLLARLRALPNERDVPADGWARLSARLPPRESQAAPAPTDNVVVLPVRSRRRWWWPAGAALAASLALYAVAPWRHAQPDTPAPSALQLQAAAMTEQYQQAVAALPDDGRRNGSRPCMNWMKARRRSVPPWRRTRVRRTCLASSSAPMRCGWN